MKKVFVACAAIIAAVAFTSCGTSKESAWRKAYEKAQAQEQSQQQTPTYDQQSTGYQEPVQVVQQPVIQEQTAVVTPLEEAPVQQQPVVVQQPQQVSAPVQTTQTTVQATQDNVPVRTETVKLVKGAGLKAYSVVVGSFGMAANAEGLQNTLINAGHNAQLVKNEERNMYRVVVSTFDTKEKAIESRDAIRATYPDAWLLMQK